MGKKSLKYASKKIGLPPGSLIHVSDILEPTTISIVDYNSEIISEKQINSISEIKKYKDTDTVTWVIINGLIDTKIIEQIGDFFGIHRLVLEDTLNTRQRPKFEEYENYLLLVLKDLSSDKKFESIIIKQISILVLKDFVIVFKEKNDDIFEQILTRLRTSRGRIRNQKSDYLTYVILDTIIDQNFVLIDSLDDTVTSLEDHLLTTEPSQSSLNRILKIKRQIISIRKHISPLRELMNTLLRCDSNLIDEKTNIYFRDVYDHIIHIVESVETYRDIMTGLLEIHITSVSNKMNEIMKILTIFATIFIPLTFIAGVYGMNFEYMPELKWKWAYPTLWVLFIVVAGFLLRYFRRKKWL